MLQSRTFARKQFRSTLEIRRKRYILLLLTLLTVTIPAIWGYHTGLNKAEDHIKRHPERFSNPEKLRTDLAGHGAIGDILFGSLIVAYFVVANAFTRGFGVMFNGVCSSVDFVTHRIRKKPEPPADSDRNSAPDLQRSAEIK